MVSIVFALIAMLATPTWAQQQTGSISGRAEDEAHCRVSPSQSPAIT
jgi:hypothetical protein